MVTVSSKDLKQLYNSVKNSAKRRNIPFELHIADLSELTFPITCPVLGIPLKFNRSSAKDDSYSVDRIDSTKGYTKDNIVIVSYRVNKLKSNASLHEMEQIYQFYSNLKS